jgi:hypothetical protein
MDYIGTDVFGMADLVREKETETAEEVKIPPPG